MTLFFLAGVAIVKDEAAYLPEWIEYHRLLGVEHFYIFDNGSTDDTDKILAKYQNYGIVTHIKWSFYPGQIPAYNYAMKIFGPSTEWMMVADPDEFFQLFAEKTLTEFLKSLEDADQVLVPYAFFGSSGHINRPSGLVIENFKHREPAVRQTVKSIVRPKNVKYADVHVSLTTTKKTVREDGSIVPERWQIPNPTQQRIRLNHYYTKSFEEYSKKISRGQVDGLNQKQLDQFESFDYTMPDESMKKYVPAVQEALHAFASRTPMPRSYGSESTISSIVYVREWMTSAHKAVGSVANAIGASAKNLDRNIDRAWLYLSPESGHYESLTSLLDRWMEAVRDVGLEVGAAQAIGWHNGRQGLSGAATPDSSGNFRVSSPLSVDHLAKIYVTFAIELENDAVMRIEIRGLDGGKSEVKFVRYIQLRMGINLGFISPCDTSIQRGEIIAHLHKLTKPGEIYNIDTWKYV